MKIHPVYQTFTSLFTAAVTLQPWSSSEKNLMVGVTMTGGTILKGRSIGKVENHISFPEDASHLPLLHPKSGLASTTSF